MLLRLLASIALAALGSIEPAAAQHPLTVPGEPAASAGPAAAPRLRLAPSRAPAPKVELPDIAQAALDEVRAANGRDRRAKPQLLQPQRVVIGLVRAAGKAAGASQWVPVEGGHALHATLRSPRAEALRLAIDLAGVPEEAQMVFFGTRDPSRLEGPVRVGDIADRTVPWWGPVTEGDTQTVELFVPQDPGDLAIRIERASHLVAMPSAGLAKRLQDIGKAGSCNVDVPCSTLSASGAFRDAAASVAQMVFTDGAYSALCTGTLLNDADPASQVPYLYSANHCFDNASAPYKTPSQMQAVASSLTTLWGFEADACVDGRGSQQPRQGWTQRSGGATYLYSSVDSDALLLRLRDAPPADAFFSGWDANPVAAATPVVSIHHPQGDLKKVTQGAVQRFSSATGSGSFIEVLWSRGTTEGGSSGGGLWTGDGSQYLFRGGLWGGAALCSNPSGSDFFSRFDLVYPAIARHLGASSGGAVDYTDLWWNPEESGWGLNLIQHPSRVIFAVWYTYAPDGKRTWFVMSSGTWTSANTYTGALYETAGPHLAQSFDATKVRVSPVGSATLTFTDADHGTFAYTVNGVSGSKAITRQPF